MNMTFCGEQCTEMNILPWTKCILYKKQLCRTSEGRSFTKFSLQVLNWVNELFRKKEYFYFNFFNQHTQCCVSFWRFKSNFAFVDPLPPLSPNPPEDSVTYSFSHYSLLSLFFHVSYVLHWFLNTSLDLSWLPFQFHNLDLHFPPFIYIHINLITRKHI